MARRPLVLSPIALLVVVGWVTLSGPKVWATHEIDHRFTIFGVVRDGSSFPGKPLAGREVRVVNGKTGQPWEMVDVQGRVLPFVITDGEGRYSAVLHVHDEDRGATVTVLVGGAAKELTLTFDPHNKITERRVRVDVVVFPK